MNDDERQTAGELVARTPWILPALLWLISGTAWADPLSGEALYRDVERYAAW